MEPLFHDYQLIGDNALFRFSKLVLGMPSKQIRASVFIGLCISGVKTKDLLQKIKTENPYIHHKVILMVGTNDILMNTDSISLRKHLHKLVHHLYLVKKVRKLILVTVPPVPRVSDHPRHWKTLKEYNEHIQTFHNGKDIIVVDAYQGFILTNKSYDPSPLSKLSKLPPMRPNCTPSFGKKVRIQEVNGNDNDENEVGEKHDYQVESEFKDTIFAKFSNLREEYQDWGKGYSEDINVKFFETHIENRRTRPDNVNLNIDGLCFLGDSLLAAIQK